MLKTKIFALALGFGLLAILSPDTAFGANEVNVNDILSVEGGDQVAVGEDFQAKTFLERLIDFLVKLVGTVALVLLVIGGFRLVVAAGDDTAMNKAKDMIKYALIGLIVALLAYIIVATVQALLYS